MPQSSRIFKGYKALGFVTNHIPICTRYNDKHKDVEAITCVGKSFHIYNCSKLAITSVGKSQGEEISCLAVDGRFIFVAAGSCIKAYTGRGAAEERFSYAGHTCTVHTLLPFGQHLLSVDQSSNVKIWDIKSEEIYLDMCFEKDCFDISAVLHPSTYLNKIVFGSKQGSLQLWNVHTNKLLYTFSGWKSHVTALEQAPAIDVIAVGLANGHIYLHNLKYDETVVDFHQDWGPITSVSFRTDGHPVMATGSPLGHIALWDLEERKLKSQIREAHNGSVTGMKCLPSEPLMITTSPDNSLNMWIFDMPDGGGRLLRQRSGHSAPPTKTLYHDHKGEILLSAGQDSTIRRFSTLHQRLDKNLGRASYEKKISKKQGLKHDTHMMPAIVDFASETSREGDWDGIAACHHGEHLVTTWNMQKGSMGAYKLSHKRFEEQIYKDAFANCVDISPCGSYVVIGYSSGHMDMYNIQSGIYRGSYGGEKQKFAHKGCVRGVCIDGLNQLTISGGSDSLVKFWRFKKQTLLMELKLSAQVANLLLHRDSGMLAVSLDDFTISVVDIETRKIVRNFHGHTNSVTDMTFSSDSRWLVTSSMDCTVRTWDLPSGCLIDCVRMDFAITSLTFSPTGDFLATTHVDDLGVYLWSNMTLYKYVSLQPLPLDYSPSLIDMPETRIAQVKELSDDTDNDDDQLEDNHQIMEFKSPEQISAELVTLSFLPNSRWQNLLKLDVIKERNKPKEPPKVRKAAPFFLPTIAGLVPKFVKEDQDIDESGVSKPAAFSMLELSKFGKLLTVGTVQNDCEPVLEYLKSIGPSAIDLELRSISPDGGGSLELMEYFLVFVRNALHKNRDYELLQAYLGLFLKLHADVIGHNSKLCAELELVKKSQDISWQRLEHHFQQSLCLVNYIRSAAL